MIGRRTRRLWLVLIGAIAFLVAIPPLVTRVVVQDDRLGPTDAIYVLNGHVTDRAAEAAKVYRDGHASRVLVALTRETTPHRPGRPSRPLSHSMARHIIAAGVPASAVTIIPFPGGVVDTRDEALALENYLATRPWRRIIVVTSDYHTGRARRTLQRELGDHDIEFLMAAAPDTDGVDPEDWWRSRAGIYRYLGEFAKQIAVVLGVSSARPSASDIAVQAPKTPDVKSVSFTPK